MSGQGGASTTFLRALHREAAQAIERAVDGMRTDHVLRRRWWRPSWDAGYAAALRDVQEEVQAVLDVHGIWYPCATPDSPAVSS